MQERDLNFSFGIEEEYFLVERATSELPTDIPPELFASLEDTLGKRVSPEFIRSQIEVNTPVCLTSADATRALTRLRRSIVDTAAQFDLAPIAAATHPIARWRQQQHTDAPRYNDIAWDFQGPGRRMLINGLHVHIGIDDKEQRIRVMNELRPYLPMLLALSTSSPFWEGENTGLKSYRTAITDATPRKGIPETFPSWAAYEGAVAVLINAGLIEDSSKIWWDIRPSESYPTLEIRITDVCPRIHDAVALASLARCLSRFIIRTERSTVDRPMTSQLVINENRWRAQRYGLEQGFIDGADNKITPISDWLEALIVELEDDIKHFSCLDDIDYLRRIARHGTSADRQLKLYAKLTANGATSTEALQQVVGMLMMETAALDTSHPNSVDTAQGARHSTATSHL
jgi:glutamate---cysteine ligase / carboxylate-amine ligase